METRRVKTKAKVITLEQEFLSLLDFYEDGEYSCYSPFSEVF